MAKFSAKKCDSDIYQIFRGDNLIALAFKMGNDTWTASSLDDKKHSMAAVKTPKHVAAWFAEMENYPDIGVLLAAGDAIFGKPWNDVIQIARTLDDADEVNSLLITSKSWWRSATSPRTLPNPKSVVEALALISERVTEVSTSMAALNAGAKAVPCLEFLNDISKIIEVATGNTPVDLATNDGAAQRL